MQSSLRSGAFSLSINLKFYFCGVHAASFVFPLTCAAEKHIISEKPLNKRFFKDTGVVPTGIECSPKISDFRANDIPVGERVDFFDTLEIISGRILYYKAAPIFSCKTSAPCRNAFYIRG